MTEVTIKLTYARDNEGFVKDINIISSKELTKLERIILQQSFKEPMILEKENEGCSNSNINTVQKWLTY